MIKKQRDKNENQYHLWGSGRLVLFSALLTFCTFLAFVWLLLIPSDLDSGILLGFSSSRLAALLMLLAAFLIFLTASIGFYRKPQLEKKVLPFFQKPKVLMAGFITALTLFLLTWSFLFFFHFLDEHFNPFIKTRLLPITCWLAVSSLIMMAGFIHIAGDRSPGKKQKRQWMPGWIALALIIAVLVLVYSTGLGFLQTTMIQTVSDLGVPLLEWQILYTVGLMVAFLLLHYFLVGLGKGAKLSERQQKTIDWMAFIFLWVLAVILWLQLPLPANNYFAPRALPPNYETYPFSDAQRYSLDALQLLYGDTQSEVISKPFFVVYLAALHLVGGVDYEKIIAIQTIILALFPAILFLIGKQLGNRAVGFGAGLLAIFREVDFIQTSDIANVSNSKLLMTDFPYTLGISILALLSIVWIRSKKQKDHRILLILGGVLGLNCLLRAQTLILIPFYILLILMKYWKRWKKFFLSSLLLLSIFLSTLLPLLIRNYSVSHMLWFDDSGYTSNFLTNYVMDGVNIENVDEDESLPDPEQAQPKESVLMLLEAIDHKYFEDVVGNFIRNFLSAFLQFPIRLKPQLAKSELMSLTNNFWKEPERYPGVFSTLIMIANSVILALGIGQVWNYRKTMFAVLIGFFLMISASSALFCFSGWRFIMPVDWIFYLFFLEGICLLFGLATGITCRDDAQPEEEVQAQEGENETAHSGVLPLVAIFGCFILAGSLIPIAELFQKQTENPRQDLCDRLVASAASSEEISEAAFSEADIRDICDAEDSLVVKGKLLYSRYFKRGYGYTSRPNVFYGTLDYGRLSFYILDDSPDRFYLPLDKWEEEDKFPNGSEAIILTTMEQQPEVLFMAVLDENGPFLVSSSLDEDIHPQSK